MRFEPSSAYSFLKDEDDEELLVQSSVALEGRLTSQFGSKPSGDLLDKTSSAWGLTPFLQMELFIMASILDRVANDPFYILTPTRRERFILAFERSMREMDTLQQKLVPSTTADKKDIMKEVEEPLRQSIVASLCALFQYGKHCLLQLSSAEVSFKISFVPTRKEEETSDALV